MTHSRTSSRVIAAATVAVFFVAAAFAAAPFNAKTAFAELKNLDGQWEGTSPEGPVDVVYHVTAHGNAVSETLFPGTAHEMVTMYYLDGDQLRMTHYCSAGNEPRMTFRKSATPNQMDFVFDSGTNMNSSRDEHMHELVIRVAGPDQIHAEWTLFKDGAKNGTSVFDLHRKG